MIENTPPINRKEVESKNDELVQEHFDISIAQHNANMVSLFASDPESIEAARKLIDNIQDVQDDNLQEARTFAAENLPTLKLLAEEEDQLRQAFIDAQIEKDERNREALRDILSKVLLRPFNRAALVGERESIIVSYCAEKDIEREQLMVNDMMVISDMPEWIAAHPDGDGGYGHSTSAGITTTKF